MKCWYCYQTVDKGDAVKINGYTLHKKCNRPKVRRFLMVLDDG